MATGSKPVLPSEFYTASTFFTLSGIAGAVWLFCLVLSNLDSTPASLTPAIYRYTALGLSLALAALMLARKKTKKKLEHWLLAFFNGLLIFINASGLNAITNKLSFENEESVIRIKESTITEKESVQEGAVFSLSMISFFKKNVSWWPDENLVRENKKLKVEYDNLKREIEQFKNKIASTENKSETISQNNEQLSDSLIKQFATLEETTNAYSNLNNKFINTSELLIACQTELEVLIDKINNITTLYEAEKDKNAELNEKYSIQTDALDKAREELAKCKLKIEGLNKEVEKISVLYNSEKGKNKKLNIEIEALKKSVNDKTIKYNELNRLYKKLIKDNNQMKKDLDACLKKLPKPVIIQ